MEESELKRHGFIWDEQYKSAVDAIEHPVHIHGGLGARPDVGDFARAKEGIDYSRRSYGAIDGMPSGADLSLGGMFSAVFDQGERATCLASAVVSFLEYYQRMIGVDCPPLSRQYFYYKLKEADHGEKEFRAFNSAPMEDAEFREFYLKHYDTRLSEKENLLKNMGRWREMRFSGSSIGHAFNVLRQCGICEEELMPYVSVQRFNTEAQLLDVDSPENAAAQMVLLDENADGYRIENPDTLRMLPGNSVDSFRRTLSGWSADKTLKPTPMPIVFGITLYQSYQSEYVERTGWLSCPLPHGDEVVGGHAMLAVGYQDSDLVPGGGYLIARNSWGEKFAWDYPAHCGHLRIPYAYIEHYAFSTAFTVVDDFSDLQGTADKTWTPYTRIAERDMRDSRGRMAIRRGEAILVDKEGLAERDTPENRRRFKEKKFSWK